MGTGGFDNYNRERRAKAHDDEYTRSYCMWGDRIIAGAWLGRFMLLWAIVWGIINFCELIYAAIWPLLVVICEQIIQFSILVIFEVVLIVYAVTTDDDIHRNRMVSEEGSDQVHWITLAYSKRSRYNAATDLGLVSFYLLFSIFTMTLTLCYWTGQPITWLHGDTRYVYNNYLTNATAFPDMTAQAIQQVNYRSIIHLTNFLVDFFVFVFFWNARITAVQLEEDLNIQKYLSGGAGHKFPTKDDAVKFGAGKGATADQVPLVKVKTKSDSASGYAALAGNTLGLDA